MPHRINDSEKIRPLGPHVLVHRVDAEETTEGGIVLPDMAKRRAFRGIVVAVGTGRVLDDGTRLLPVAKIGDDIIFKEYVGTELAFDDKDYLLVNEADIYAVIE